MPSSRNINPKALILFDGDGSSNKALNSGLGGAGPKSPLVADYQVLSKRFSCFSIISMLKTLIHQGCLVITIASGFPAGKYTIKLQGITNPTTLASLAFNLAQVHALLVYVVIVLARGY